MLCPQTNRTLNANISRFIDLNQTGLLVQSSSETEPIKHAGHGETEGKCAPNAHQTCIKIDAKKITQGQRNDEIRQESHINQRPDIRQTAQRIGIVGLHTVAELIDDKRDNGHGNHADNIAGVCE